MVNENVLKNILYEIIKLDRPIISNVLSEILQITIVVGQYIFIINSFSTVKSFVKYLCGPNYQKQNLCTYIRSIIVELIISVDVGLIYVFMQKMFYLIKMELN